jgi:hypothetical protein
MVSKDLLHYLAQGIPSRTRLPGSHEPKPFRLAPLERRLEPLTRLRERYGFLLEDHKLLTLCLELARILRFRPFEVVPGQ